MRIGDKVRNGKDLVHPFDHKGSVYCVPYGNCNQKFSNTRRKEHINCIKNFHPEESALAKHALQLEHGTNWWKTLKIVAFETDFRKKCFIESFFINSTPNVMNKNSSDLFPKICKEMYGYIWLNTRLNILLRSGLSRRTVCFLTLLLYFTLQSILRYLLCLFNVVINVITTSCNHPPSVNSTAFLFSLTFALKKAYC